MTFPGRWVGGGGARNRGSTENVFLGMQVEKKIEVTLRCIKVVSTYVQLSI